MDSTTLTRQLKLDKWAEIVRLRQESGLTVADWCEENSISKATYYYWLKRLRQTACDQFPAAINKSINPIVPVTFEEPVASLESNSCSSYAMRVTVKGISAEFTNDATPRLIENALQTLSHAR
ncbi:MAG: helix-turn-helix domain-containing protein [Clostridia bacterium]|nr:helix-turn-helix domain-containing protein [Clostridia bacterium]